MGFNTGILLCNDALYQAEQDKASFATNLLNAIGEQCRVKYNESVDFSIGNHCNGGTVFWQSHADNIGIFAIGGNYVTHLGTECVIRSHHRDQDKLAILHMLARQFNMDIVPKQRRRKPVIK